MRHAWMLAAALTAAAAGPPPIDRHALVTRHDPVLHAADLDAPLSVGNGDFAVTVDITGLQTFADDYAATVPLGTLSQWGWHSFPNPHHWTIDRYPLTLFDAHGRDVGYADVPGNGTAESAWLRANPHRLHLGRLGFRLRRADGTPATLADLTAITQSLDLWTGTITSRFSLGGVPVTVRTACAPDRDALAVRVASPLVAARRIAIDISFPYGSADATGADWTRPDAHTTTVERDTPGAATFRRTLDADHYAAAATWTASTRLDTIGPHHFVVEASPGQDALDFAIAFAPGTNADPPPDFTAVSDAAARHWERFWETGGAIDLSASADPRWRELERRIVLSQYLTAIQCAGPTPPQESGLTFNSWHGKFHLEMHWWHAAHFALWGRLPLVERSLDYYDRILPRARAAATRQGYAGARWPKMTDPSGAESPSTIGPFLIWQQPHPIFYAELAYRAHPERATLDRFRDVVFATADFMASFAAWDAPGGRYVLGPPLEPAQEVFPRDRTFDPTFELTYWRWGLQTAERWRERLGLPRDPGWDRVLSRLAAPAVVDGKYLFVESQPDSYEAPRWRTDHPAVLAALGMLPGPSIDEATMRRTVDWVWTHWDWASTWGWDYPMMAMTAARLGEPARAVDALLMPVPKNGYRVNGHNAQRPGLTVYLPGNGGLLYATAMMAAGWDGAPDRDAPGFPDDGSWVVRWEDLQRAP